MPRSCLSVHGNTALVAAVVPEGHGNVRNHGFYLKIINGSRARPDQIETVQAQTAPTARHGTVSTPWRTPLSSATRSTAAAYLIHR
jgi:hypothetical protein